jgi:hypothetical protein
MTNTTLSLTPGTRLRTGGTTYEVMEDANLPAGIVPVVPQSARLLKVFCEACGYVARVTQRWITKSGTPICPCGHGAMAVAAPKGETAAPVEAPVIKAIPAKPKAKAKPVPPVPVADVEFEAIEVEFAAPEDFELTPSAPSTLAQLLEQLQQTGEV